MPRSLPILLLVSVLTETLFTLVRRHLMSFSLLSAWHGLDCLLVSTYLMNEIIRLLHQLLIGRALLDRLQGGNRFILLA